MSHDAKNYKNTIELCAEKLFSECEIYAHDALDMNGEYTKWKNAGKGIQDYVRFKVVTVLNAVNYFEGKQCKDCGYFDHEKSVCFGEDREHSERVSSPICETFAPMELVIAKGE